MSDLPDDIEQWPRDCFQILGVPIYVGEKELRRAYFRLVKKYKPDIYPAEFQRVHEAYEMAKRRLAHSEKSNEEDEFWDQPYSVVPKDPDLPTLQHPFARQQSNFQEPTQDGRAFTESLPEYASQFWELASKGLVQEALGILPKISSKRDHDLARFAEYFLRRVSPDRKDPIKTRERVALLLQFLGHPHLGPNASYYLENELHCSPHIAKLDLVEDLIRNSGNATVSHALARTRWKAIGQDCPELVVADMAILKELFSQELEHSASEALEYTIWHSAEGFESHNEACLQILNETQSNLADVADVLTLAARESKDGISAWNSNDIGSRVRKARTGFSSQMEAIWQPISAEIASSHSESLEKLESIVETKPISMSIFRGGLERFVLTRQEFDYSMNPTGEQVTAEIGSFFHRNRIKFYSTKNRLRILDFCICNHVDPRIFGRVADTFVPFNESLYWSVLLQQDIALNCIYQASIADQL